EKQTLTPLETEIIRINNSTSNDVSKAVAGLLTDRGKVSSDPRTNSLILQEIPENIPKIIDFITELDLPPRQIMISAKLIEVNSKFLQELGTRLGFTANGTSGQATVNSAGTSDGVTGRITDPFGTYSFNLVHPDYTVDGLVNAIISDGNGKILAHPEITTIENKQARIQMGQKIPIKQFDESGNVTTIFEQVGTILHVTPHITADDQILMELKPERSFAEIGAQGVVISTNNASTNVIVHNGQTAVIGGLTTDDENTTESGIPVLKDIPVLGYLFSYSKKTRESRDLIIFVTPTIIESTLAQTAEPENETP
ncbi:MAG: secretin N-terminal domain-containing protein, partial [Candidatus Zixiibacteriota bacterium]